MTTSLLQHYRDEIVRIHGHIDARGVMQVQRIVHLKLDDVYVNLKARLRQDRSAPFERRKRDGGRNGSGRPSGPMSDEAEREAGWAAFFEPAAREERGVSLEDLWRRHRYWVLLGDPGAGKTTVLRHLAYQGAREGDPLPVYITLRYLANEQSRHGWGAQDTLLCYLQDFGLAELGFDPEERAALVAEIRARLEAGRAVLLLDGLDEQREPEMKQKTREAIESLIRRYPQNRCLCSSRITGYDAAPLGAEFQTAELEPYSDEQMREFFRRWLTALERGEDLLGDPEAAARRAAPKAEALIGQVEAHAGVRALASNPLLCTVIALIHRQGGTLPQHRAELYKLCTDTFIFNWEMHKRRLGQTDEGLDKDETQAVLEQIALHLHAATTDNQAPRAMLETLTREHLVARGLSPEEAGGRAGRLVDLIRDVAGLLVDRGAEHYGFFHLTFQEYLTARAITRRRAEIAQYLNRYLLNPRWREVIRLASANQGLKDEESGSRFIEVVSKVPHPREERMRYAFRMAFLCGRETPMEFETQDRLAADWITVYLNRGWLRGSLSGILDTPGLPLRYSPTTCDYFLRALENSDPRRRQAAAMALGYFVIPEGRSALVDRLGDRDWRVRKAAARALGRVGEPPADAELLACLADDRRDVRLAAAEAIGQLKNPAAVPGLLDCLSNASWGVREAAAFALGELGTPDALSVLVEDVIKDPDGHVRSAAASALGKLSDSAASTALLNCLGDRDRYVRRAASWALSRLQSPETLAALLDCLEKQDRVVRAAAAWTLGQLGDPGSIPALLARLEDERPDVRAAAAGALGRLADTHALPALLAHLADPDGWVRAAVAEALGQFADPKTLPVLLAGLGDDDLHVRAACARALGQLKDPQTLPGLVKCLAADSHPEVRAAAASALGALRDHGALPVLIERLGDWNGDVRAAAARALGEFQDPSALSALIERLRDDEWYVRTAAAEAIESIDCG